MEGSEARVCALAIRPDKRAALEERSSLQVTPTSGVVDDHGTGPRRHLTILAQSQWQTVCQQLGHDLPWTIRRANMLVSGIEFDAEWNGKTLSIGDVKLLVHGELTPCFRMEEQVSGLHDLLLPDWRGGVHCEVLDVGEIKIGDSLEIHDGASDPASG